MVRLFMLYAILIFAKRAPKMISELLKIKGDGVGLKGLNIKNKLGEAALVGDKVKKGLTKAEGGIRGAVGGAAGAATGGFGRAFAKSWKDGKGLKDSLKNGFSGGAKGFGKGFITGGKNGIAAGANAKDGNLKGIASKAYKQSGQVARGGADSVGQKLKNRVNSVGEKVSAKGYGSLSIARSNEAEKLKGELRGVFGAKGGGDIINALMNKGYRGSDGNIVSGEDIFNDSTAFNAFKKDLKGIRGATSASDLVKAGIDPSAASSLLGEADGLSLMENIHKERAKHLGNIQEYAQRYLNAPDGSAEKEALRTQMLKEIKDNANLFAENANSGVNLGISEVSFGERKYTFTDEFTGEVKTGTLEIKPSMLITPPTSPGEWASDEEKAKYEAIKDVYEKGDGIATWATTDAYTVTKKNDKALSDVQKDIQARDAVEAESGTKKDK